MRTVLMALLLLAAVYAQGLSKREKTDSASETSPSQQNPSLSREPTSVVSAVPGQPSPKPEENDSSGEALAWPNSSDPFWSNWALVVVTAIAVFYAVQTLKAIQSQVAEMRKTGDQTDQLIREAIAQSQEAVRASSAMENIAKGIQGSTRAATDSTATFAARGQMQMRAYVCVSIATGRYQDRALKIKFEGCPNLRNFGNTPAYKVSYRANAAILPVPIPMDFDFPITGPEIGGSLLPPHDPSPTRISVVVPEFMPDDEVDRIKAADGKGLYIWEIINYEDVFGVRHWTQFAHQIYFFGDKVSGMYLSTHNDAD